MTDPVTPPSVPSTPPAVPPWFVSRVTGPTGGPIEAQLELAGRGGGPMEVRLSGSVDVRVQSDAAPVAPLAATAPVDDTPGRAPFGRAGDGETPPDAETSAADDFATGEDGGETGEDHGDHCDDGSCEAEARPAEAAPTPPPAPSPVAPSELEFTTFTQTDAAFDEPRTIICSIVTGARRTTLSDVRLNHFAALGLTPHHKPWVKGMQKGDDYTPEAGDRVVWKRAAGDKGEES